MINNEKKTQVVFYLEGYIKEELEKQARQLDISFGRILRNIIKESPEVKPCLKKIKVE